MEIHTSLITVRDDYDVLVFGCSVGGKQVHFQPVWENSEDRLLSEIAVDAEDVFRLATDELAAVKDFYRRHELLMHTYYEIIFNAESGPTPRRLIEKVMALDLTEWEMHQCSLLLREFTYVYLVKDERTGLVKIGRTGDPEKRLKTLIKQDTLLPEPNQFSFIRCWNTRSYNERALHRRFSERRIRGEWFRLEDRDLYDIDEQFVWDVQWAAGTTAIEDYERGLEEAEGWEN